MGANTLDIPKSYRDGISYTEAIVDAINSSIESWASDTVNNLNQFRADVFGTSYSLDNDGLANNTNPMNVQQTITPTATITGLNVSGGSLTTGTGSDINTLDALTSGFGLRVRSNSGDTSTRTLVQIINDNTAATGCTPFAIQQDAAIRAAYINQTANAEGLILDKDGTGAGNTLTIDDEGTGVSISTTHAGATGRSGDFHAESAAYADSNIRSLCSRAANTAYDFFLGTSGIGGAPDNEARIRGDGEISGDAAAYATPAADYAEMFECSDSNGIEPGYFVALEEKSSLIRKASSKDDYVLGVVSAHPACLADAAWGRWAKKWLLDELNDYILDDNGDRILNPKYRPGVYIPRQERDEWVAVGMLGKLNVRTSEDIVKDYVDVDEKGMAKNGSTYRVIETIRQFSDDPGKKGYGVVKIIFR